MSRDIIDDMTAIIASLTSRNEELEEEVRKLKVTAAVDKKTEVNEKQNGDSTTEEMYHNIIDTLKCQSTTDADEIKRLTAELSSMEVLRHSYAALKEENKKITVAKEDLEKSCSILSGSCNALSNKLENLQAKPDPHTYCRDCGENTLHTECEGVNYCTTCLIRYYKEPNIDSDDAKIVGYQKVILALTDKLAEAYGIVANKGE